MRLVQPFSCQCWGQRHSRWRAPGSVGVCCSREDWLPAPAGGRPAVSTGLPGQPGLPRLPVHAVHPPRVLAHALPRAVSTARPRGLLPTESQLASNHPFPPTDTRCLLLTVFFSFPLSHRQGLLSRAAGACPDAG